MDIIITETGQDEEMAWRYNFQAGNQRITSIYFGGAVQLAQRLMRSGDTYREIHASSGCDTGELSFDNRLQSWLKVYEFDGTTPLAPIAKRWVEYLGDKAPRWLVEAAQA